MSMFLFTCGKGSKRRVVHLARYNYNGDITGSLCGKPTNTSCNLPLGLRICKDCKTKLAASDDGDNEGEGK